MAGISTPLISNHDGDFVPPGLDAYEEYKLDGLVFRHEAKASAKDEISGHFHPKAKIEHQGRG